MAEDTLHVAEGETLVLTEDSNLNVSHIRVEGTLVIDGIVERLLQA